MAKRARPCDTDAVCAHRVVLEVGEMTFTTTRTTLERCSYFAGLIDSTKWDADPSHTEKIFVDRDPTIFAHCLRLMRQQPLVSGLLPGTDPTLFAALLAEADFFGFEGLLQHVKATAYYHSRTARDDFPTYKDFFTPPAGDVDFLSEERRAAVKKAKRAVSDECTRIRRAFAIKDEVYGASQFDKVYGSIAEALSSQVLPASYLAPPKSSTKIIQLMPVEATTWFLLGDTYDDKYTVVEGNHFPQDDQMKPMREWLERPGLVRRVAYHALVEDQLGNRWTEPMLYISADDQEEWMNHQPTDGSIISRDNTLDDPTLEKLTGGLSRRIIMAKDYITLIFETAHKPDLYQTHKASCWSHLLVTEEPPLEAGFSRELWQQQILAEAEADAQGIAQEIAQANGP